MSPPSPERHSSVRIFDRIIQIRAVSPTATQTIINLPKPLYEDWELADPDLPGHLRSHVETLAVRDSKGPTYVVVWPAADGKKGKNAVPLPVSEKSRDLTLPGRYFGSREAPARIQARFMAYGRIALLSPLDGLAVRLNDLSDHGLDPGRRRSIGMELLNIPQRTLGRRAIDLDREILRGLFPGADRLIPRSAVNTQAVRHPARRRDR